MRNLLQDTLLKAGLVKKSKLDQVVREQAKQRQGKAAPADAPSEPGVDAAQLLAQRAERDRALAAERKEQARFAEQATQIRQLIESNRVQRQGEIPYRFTDGGVIKSVLVDNGLRTRLSKGTLVIARVDADHYELLPREAAERVRARDASVIVVDHGAQTGTEPAHASAELDEHYSKFVVPDDLIW